MNFTQFFTQTLSVFGVGSPASSVRRDGQGASGSPRRQSKTVGGLGGRSPRKLTAYYGYFAAKPCIILCI